MFQVLIGNRFVPLCSQIQATRIFDLYVFLGNSCSESDLRVVFVEWILEKGYVCRDHFEFR